MEDSFLASTVPTLILPTFHSCVEGYSRKHLCGPVMFPKKICVKELLRTNGINFRVHVPSGVGCGLKWCFFVFFLRILLLFQTQKEHCKAF